MIDKAKVKTTAVMLCGFLFMVALMAMGYVNFELTSFIAFSILLTGAIVILAILLAVLIRLIYRGIYEYFKQKEPSQPKEP